MQLGQPGVEELAEARTSGTFQFDFGGVRHYGKEATIQVRWPRMGAHQWMYIGVGSQGLPGAWIAVRPAD